MRRSGIIFCVSILALMGCKADQPNITTDVGPDVGTDTGTDTGAPPPSACVDPEGISYHRDVRPLIVKHCFDCHSTVNGSISAGKAYDWTTWENVYGFRNLIVSDVAGRVMPPWPMDPECRTIENSRSLSDADIATFEAWAENGHCEGDEADYVDPGWKPVSTDYSDADITTSPATAWALPENITEEDVFRCYKLTATFAEDTWVVASATTPDSPLSHHALVYVAMGASEAEVDAKAAKYDGEGWGDCDSGVGIPSVVLGGWVPGMGKIPYPSESAYLVPKGAILLLQMHYSGVGATADDLSQLTDQPKIHLWTLPAGEVPKRKVTVKPFSDHSFKVPLGETHVASKTHPAPANAEIFAVVSHQHLIGTHTSLTLERQDGSTACLSNIPKWDFDWQLIYNYAAEDYVSMKKGDSITVSCTFPYTEDWVKSQLGSNAPDPLPPVLKWGEASYEEMCISYVWFVSDWTGSLTVDECIASCGTGNPDCVIECFANPDLDTACLLGVINSCGETYCEDSHAALFGCLATCDLDDTLDCVKSDVPDAPCTNEFEAFISCIEPHVAGGECAFTECD